MPFPTSLRVLVVDDDVLDRMAVRRALVASWPSVSVSEAEDVAGGVAALHNNPFDCAILDFQLPDGDGLELLSRVRGAGISIPVIMLTGYSDAQTAVELMKAGATDYIPKAALSADRLDQSLRYAFRLRAAEEQVRRYTGQLHELANAALRINATLSAETMLTAAAEEASRILGARRAHATLAEDTGMAPTGVSPDTTPAPRTIGAASQDEGITAPLAGRDGAVLGVLHVADKTSGDFTDSDRALLAQLAQLTSGAIENARLFETARAATRARDDVLAIVSHDLRNPLHTIQMAASLVLELAPAEDRRLVTRQQIEIVRRSAARANRLIEDLLDATRLEAGTLAIRLTPVPAEQLVRDAVDLLTPLATAAGITLVTAMPSALPVASAEAERILQVFSNVGGNAIKFTPRGGRVVIDAVAQGEEIRFSVADSGAGIAPDDLAHVFDRYWQGRDRTRLGAGLGLWIAKGIVEAHGGRIAVESTVGAGTTVWFTLRATVPDSVPGGSSDAHGSIAYPATSMR